MPDRPTARGARLGAMRGARRVVTSLTVDALAQVRSHVDNRTGDLQRHVDLRSGEVTDRLREVTERLALLTTRIESLEQAEARLEQAADRQAQATDRLGQQVAATAGELTRLAADQVQGANDANEILGRVLAQLRDELQGLNEAVDALNAKDADHPGHALDPRDP